MYVPPFSGAVLHCHLQNVQVFIRLLDETLGDGRQDGSMQQTALLRAGANITWEYIALRPWSLENTYNSREEVDAGLSAWSTSSKKYLALYKKIQKQYHIAEKELTKYYKKTFNLTQKKAEKLAKYALDIGYRDNFLFSSTSKGSVKITNPWNE